MNTKANNLIRLGSANCVWTISPPHKSHVSNWKLRPSTGEQNKVSQSNLLPCFLTNVNVIVLTVLISSKKTCSSRPILQYAWSSGLMLPARCLLHSSFDNRHEARTHHSILVCGLFYDTPESISSNDRINESTWLWRWYVNITITILDLNLGCLHPVTCVRYMWWGFLFRRRNVTIVDFYKLYYRIGPRKICVLEDGRMTETSITVK
jgi:hypothetical protein